MHYISNRTFSSQFARSSVRFFTLSLLLTGTLPCLWAQQAEKSQRNPTSAKISSTSPALAVLRRRTDAVEAAKASGNAESVDQASRQLIALCLRQMAHLRLVEGAFPQSIELYLRSLDFEDLADTRVDLAVAYLRAKNADESLTEANRAVVADPQNFRAWQIQGKAYMLKKDYGDAAESLAHANSIHLDMEAVYSRAICLLQNHEKEKAAAVFQQMIGPAHDRGTLHVLFARAYRDADYLDDAVRELKLALEADPKTLHAHYLLGLVYLLQEEWAPKPEIRQQFLAELQLNPRDFFSNYLLGAIGSNEKDYLESDHYLKIATDINPSWPEPWLYMGLNASSQGDNKRAEEALRKAIFLTGTDDARSNYFIRKAYFALGRILSESGQKQDAQTYLRKARELQARVQAESVQDSPMGSEKAGREVLAFDQAKEESPTGTASTVTDSTAELDASVLARANLSEPETRQALVQEKHLRPVLAAGLNDLATSEAIRQQYAPALEHYQEAGKWDITIPGLQRNSGMTAARAGNYADAVRALSAVVSEKPTDNTARAMLGMSYYMTDQYKDAAQTISPLGDSTFKDPGLAYAWADSLAKQGLFPEASGVLEKLGSQAVSIDTLMLMGQLWDQIGNHSLAIQTFHQVLQREPTRPKAHYYAGVANIRSDQPAEAATEFKAELALTPDDPDAKYNLGFADLQLSQRDEAVAWFQSVLSSHPDHAEAQYQLGKILMDEGKTKEAITYLEAAARLSPQSDYMHYQLQAAYRKDSRTEDADRELQLYKEIKARNHERLTPKPQSN